MHAKKNVHVCYLEYIYIYTHIHTLNKIHVYIYIYNKYPVKTYNANYFIMYVTENILIICDRFQDILREISSTTFRVRSPVV